MGVLLLLVWVGLAASLSFNAAMLVRNAQLKGELAEAMDRIDSLEALQGAATGNESWRNDVL